MKTYISAVREKNVSDSPETRVMPQSRRRFRNARAVVTPAMPFPMMRTCTFHLAAEGPAGPAPTLAVSPRGARRYTPRTCTP
jgi:hypothetical protein